jgi:transposase
MNRKLPPDEEVLRLWRSGMTQKQIAEKFGCGQHQVKLAVRRTKGVPTSAKATAGREFLSVREAPIEHRETKERPAGTYQTIDTVYRAQHLDIHECADLLREWGAA